MHEENILIPKNKDTKLDESSTAEDQVYDNMQQEVRKLHVKVQQQAQLIKDLQKGGDVSVATIASVATEPDSEYEQKCVCMLKGEIPIALPFKESLYLPPEQLTAIAESLKKSIAAREELQKKLTVSEGNYSQLKNALESKISDTELSQIQVTQQLQEAEDKHRKEMDQMTKFLEQKIEITIRKEQAIDEIKDAYRALEQTMSTGGDNVWKQKVLLLEREFQ